LPEEHDLCNTQDVSELINRYICNLGLNPIQITVICAAIDVYHDDEEKKLRYGLGIFNDRLIGKTPPQSSSNFTPDLFSIMFGNAKKDLFYFCRAFMFSKMLKDPAVSMRINEYVEANKMSLYEILEGPNADDVKNDYKNYTDQGFIALKVSKEEKKVFARYKQALKKSTTPIENLSRRLRRESILVDTNLPHLTFFSIKKSNVIADSHVDADNMTNKPSLN
jgi:hypothetical protein